MHTSSGCAKTPTPGPIEMCAVWLASTRPIWTRVAISQRESGECRWRHIGRAAQWTGYFSIGLRVRPCVLGEQSQASVFLFYPPGNSRAFRSDAQLLVNRCDGRFESRATTSGPGGSPATRVHTDLAAAAAFRRMSSSSASVARPCSTTILPSTMTVDTSRPTPTCTRVPRGWNAGVRWARRKSNRTRSAFFPTLRLPSS